MLYIGIDLGGTNIAAAVVNEDFEILGRAKYKTRAPRPAEEIATDMAAAARDALCEAGASVNDVAWVGVGAPGSVNPVTGEIEFSIGALMFIYDFNVRQLKLRATNGHAGREFTLNEILTLNEMLNEFAEALENK